MKRIGFIMKLLPGHAAEYIKRHDEIWPELISLLKTSGIRDYSIFLDESTNQLFGYLKIEEERKLDKLSDEPVMRKWWTYMKDIMETHEDASPVSLSLQEVFYLP
ncbi:MAG: L-rhamnose mutarotase [Chitinophagales bacterium]